MLKLLDSCADDLYYLADLRPLFSPLIAVPVFRMEIVPEPLRFNMNAVVNCMKRKNQVAANG